MEQHVARQRIKDHLRRRGFEPITLTTSVVTHWWRVLNTAVFDGKLPTPVRVDLVQHRKAYAWCYPLANKRVRLSICPRLNSRRLFLTILVHEMVHAWEHLNELTMGHGPSFFQHQNRIRRTTTLKLEQNLDETKHNDYDLIYPRNRSKNRVTVRSLAHNVS
jgi:hypothetical protein